MSTAEIIQIASVSALVLITAYYAVQTHRQANLLSKQMKEKRHARSDITLDEVLSWADNVHKAIWMVKKKDIEKDIETISDNLLFLLGQSIVVMEVGKKINLDLGIEILDCSRSISAFLKHLGRMDSPQAILDHFEIAKDLEQVLVDPKQSDGLRERLNDERLDIMVTLWEHLTNIKVIVSKLRG
ncbi:hypothetical protein ACFLTZ_04500 [Chloroflexota bacterium]